jgi:hypothetical protein
VQHVQGEEDVHLQLTSAKGTFAFAALAALSLAACSAPSESTSAEQSRASASALHLRVQGGAPLYVTSVDPSSGLNTGQTWVKITGYFLEGETQFLFGGTPATNVTCESYVVCWAQTPPGSMLSTDETVRVEAVVEGREDLSDVQYTYTAGPACTTQLTCAGVGFGFPDMVVTCPVDVEFYDFVGTPNEVLVGAGRTRTESTNDVPRTLRACTLPSGSCTDLVVEGPSNYCGTLPPPPPNFCTQCEASGGICSTYKGKRTCIHE